MSRSRLLAHAAPVLPVLLAFTLLATTAASAAAQDRRNEARTLDGAYAPRYVANSTAERARDVTLVLTGPAGDPYQVASAIGKRASAKTMVVVVDGRVNREDWMQTFQTEDAVDDERVEEERVVGRMLARDSWADALERYGLAGLPVSIITAYDGFAIALNLLERGHVDRDSVVSFTALDPHIANAPSLEDAVGAFADASRTMHLPCVDVLLLARSAAEVQGAREELQATLGAWAADLRVFAARAQELSIAKLYEAAWLLQDGHRIAYTAGNYDVDPPRLVNDIVGKQDILVFGELHDDAIGHRLQLDLFRRLHGAQPKIALAMEMFERDVQPVLDSYLAGEIDEAAFLADSRPWPNYATDYRPLIEYAKANGIPVIAGNVPRRIARAIATAGPDALDALPEEDKPFVARALVANEGAYRDQFFETMQAMMSGHGHGSPTMNLEWMYAAQCIKDDTMAESIAGFLGANPGTLVLQLNGAFHSDQRLGVVEKLRALDADLRIATLSLQRVANPGAGAARELDDEVADYIVRVPERRPPPVYPGDPVDE